MSTTSTPNDSPAVQPLHNPSKSAQIYPNAPLGSMANNPGMGAKALLQKKMAKGHNPNFISPTDNLMTPVTQKLNAAKKKQFTKGAKPVKLFGAQPASEEENESDKEPSTDKPTETSTSQPTSSLKMEVDDENPF
ncbi:hypothetical protein BKA70DRAFT_1419901 [Coprinopsis sp. MPI-PUGE-AT-0042]|nr:hypothetical protein BKA70DRAFT_1419901 [Coprinopsis sp. MPI-PUGE-AT-0042]